MKSIIYTLFLFLILFNTVQSDEISGVPKVTDGDSILIGSKKIRLYGVDAPEIKQKCKKAFLTIMFVSFQKKYDCGLVSKKALQNKINNKIINCKILSLDRYKRSIAICYINKTDINMWMVKNGYAVAYKKYSKKYYFQELEAKEKRVGLWSGSFMEPEKWRRKYK